MSNLCYYRGIVPVTCDNLFSKIEKGGDSNQVSEQQSHVSFLAWKYMSKNNCMESVIITLGLYEKNKIKLSWWFLEDILQARVHLNTSLKRNTLLGLFTRYLQLLILITKLLSSNRKFGSKLSITFNKRTAVFISNLHYEWLCKCGATKRQVPWPPVGVSPHSLLAMMNKWHFTSY